MRFAHFQFNPKADKLGEGPSSEVYRAVDTQLGRTVALKILRPHIEFDPAAKERFEREAKHTSNLAHQNIATVFEYGQDRGTSFIAMEYLEGRTLDRILRDHRLDYEEGMRIALQVCAAVGLVHERGLIHRDLKPANIMVMDDGAVKLLDFGICRSSAESNITQEGMLVGTVLYMSPEQVLGEDIDFRSDVFALGSVFYHAFTGELAFPGKTFPEVCLSILESKPRRPSEIRSGFPPPLEEFLLRCLSREKKDRYPNGPDARGALLAVSDKIKVTSSADRPSTLAGKICIPPFLLRDETETAEAFAGGMRADLSTELIRSTHLDVTLPEGDELPRDADGFVLRGTLDLEGDRGTVDVVLERGRPGSNGTGDTALIWHDRIEQHDNDEWGLQAKLVGALVRSLKRRLTEYALAPPPEVQRDPAKAENLAHRAHDLLHRGTTRHLMAAVATFRVALKEDEHCKLAHAGLAESYVRKFMYWDGDVSFLQEAREHAQRALTLDTFSAEAHTALGFAHLMSGDLTEAQRELRLAIQIDHEEWLAHRLLGGLLARTGNYEGASPLLQRAIVLRPAHIGSYDHLYNVLCRLDRYEEAIGVADRGMAAAKKHLQEVPDDQEARVHLALLQARMGLADEAYETIEEARGRAKKDPYTLFHAGCVHALLDEPEQAVRLLTEAQERGFYLQSEAPRNPDLETLRGRRDYQELFR
jgi:tetratricopeptide (TPR) repeat protein/predicted Ser/Thr protein kinase/TolB-like protein